MENTFLMLFLHNHVPEYLNQRWPPDAILKIQHFDYLSQNVVQYVFIGVFAILHHYQIQYSLHLLHCKLRYFKFLINKHTLTLEMPMQVNSYFDD